jgi:hypothetical protein
MTESELAAFAESWIAFANAPMNTPEYDELFWVFDRVYDLMNDEPEEVWKLILKILSLNNSDAVHEILAAGPLEDLLTKHGSTMIERVVLEANSNPAFALLLGGVWKNSMADEVWEKVQANWNRSGWDGLP